MKRLLGTTRFLCLLSGVVCLAIGGGLGFWIGISNAGPLQAVYPVAPIDASGCAIANLSIVQRNATTGRYVQDVSIPPAVQCVVINTDLAFPSLKPCELLTAKSIPGETAPPSSSLSIITYPRASDGKIYEMDLTSLPTQVKASYQGRGQTRLEFQGKTSPFQNTLPDIAFGESPA